MKGKLTAHYFVFFVVACLSVFLVNITFMISNIYKLNGGELIDYYPDDIINEFANNIITSDSGNIIVNNQGIEFLQKNNIGVQIIDEENKEIFQYNKSNRAPVRYTNLSLIELYNDKSETMFLNEKVINDKIYTYLLFLDTEKIKRVTLSYDVNELLNAHRFPLLVFMNFILISIISFLYTMKITKPITHIIDRILELGKGDYLKKKIRFGIFSDVEKELNKLGERLSENEKEREKLDEMRDEWISNISHDIKTPLTSIRGNAEILGDADYIVDTNTRVKSANIIINKSDYIKDLVEDLNLSTRLKSNTLVLNKKKVNIVSLLRHVIIDIINDQKYSEANIGFDYSDEDIFIDLDQQLIKRVFVNLIINAFVHNDSDVKIKINIEKLEDNSVKIIVSDNGKGVSEEELNHIFQRYYRGTDTRRKIEGSGLGMAIAHDIIKAHKAEIKAMNDINSGFKIQVIFK